MQVYAVLLRDRGGTEEGRCMFEIDNSQAENGCIRRYEKKHMEECASCLENLLEVKEYLSAGMPLAQVLNCCSYLRSEGEDNGYPVCQIERVPSK